jgi:hypothetical protein
MAVLTGCVLVAHDADRLASISFISFIASMMQSTCPSWTRSPSATKGAASGAGAR